MIRKSVIKRGGCVRKVYRDRVMSEPVRKVKNCERGGGGGTVLGKGVKSHR